MSVPRINPKLMSAAARENLERLRINPKLMSSAASENLERLQAKLGLDNLNDSCESHDEGENDKKGGHKKKTLTPDMAGGLVKSVKVSEDGNEVTILLAVNADCIPTAQGKGAFVDKGGHVHFFTKPKQRKAEETLKIALEPYAHLTSKWGEVPVEIDFRLLFSYPASTPKKHRHKIGPHLQKPDGDNVIKNFIDSMTRVRFWKDDSLINTYHIYKRRTSGPACIVVKIKNLQPKFDALFRDTEEHEKPTLFNASSPPVRPEETNPLSELMTGATSIISSEKEH